MNEIVPVTLTVTFDVDQVSGDLNWSLTPDAQPKAGPHAGAVYFEKGTNLFLEVIGYGGKNSGLSSFQIVDCCIITRPQIIQIGAAPMPTLYAAPSPFLQAVGASYSFGLDFSSTIEAHVEPKDSTRITQRWKHSLNISHSAGRWELSLVLTIRILRGLGHVTETRVFSFDPESEVGDGSDPGA